MSGAQRRLRCSETSWFQKCRFDTVPHLRGARTPAWCTCTWDEKCEKCEECHTFAALKANVQVHHAVIHLQRLPVLLEVLQHRPILHQRLCVPNRCVADHSFAHINPSAVEALDSDCVVRRMQRSVYSADGAAQHQMAAILGDASQERLCDCLAAALQVPAFVPNIRLAVSK